MKHSTHKNIMSLEFRGVQLDLARQPENLDYIKSFIDFISQYGYNYLVLYLEGRIKTKSFPYRKDSESYSPDEMKEIVTYAGEKNIEVVPVVSMLGHAEHFVGCPELEHLAELRGDREGRFSTFKHVFCPSQKETLEFLEKYVTEVSELFPSKYFHAGFDEAWDIGYCDLCKQRLETETQSDLFKKQILDCYNIISKKLNKKMIIWDDLFDIYPDALKDIPRDVIMCSWHYDKLVEKPAGHCGGPGTDIATLYEKLGFECIFAPAAFSIRNVETFTKYAANKKMLGGLLTSWELERGFLLHNYPTVAYAGKLWSGNCESHPAAELQENIIKEVTGCDKDEQINVIRTMLNTRSITLPNNPQTYLRGALIDEEYERKSLVGLAQILLKPYLPMPVDRVLQADILNDLAIRVEIEAIYFEIRELLPSLYSLTNIQSERKNLNKQTESCIERIKSLRGMRQIQWDKHRTGVEPNHSKSYFDSVIEMLHKTLTDSEKIRAFLNVKFKISGGKTAFFVRYENDNKWQKIASGSFKANSYSGPYQYTFPIYTDKTPATVRIETNGYVGTGILFLEFETLNERFVPESFSVVGGNVEHPEHLLEDGRDWCFLGDGEQNARGKFNKPSLAKAKNIIEINLKKEEF